MSNYMDRMGRVKNHAVAPVLSTSLTRGRLGDLVRTFVRITADIYAATDDDELKAKAYDLHRAAAALAKEANMTGGQLATELLSGEAERDAQKIKALKAEIKRLEGGGQPAKVANLTRKLADSKREAKLEATHRRRLERKLEAVAKAVREHQSDWW